MESHPSPHLPRLSPSQNGVPGRVKEYPEDFIVEEIPLYEPSGEGEHVWAFVEKRAMTTPYLARQLARATGVPLRDIGYAGRKDRQAVTTQVFTLRGADPERVERVEIDGVRILRVTLHRRRIRRGHLRANRFRITVRNVDTSLIEHAEKSAALLNSRGLPNYFGPQRFGRAGSNAKIGSALLNGESDDAIRFLLAGAASTRSGRRISNALERGTTPQKALGLLPRDERRLYLESFQSELFNRCLARRLPAFDQVWCGDLAQKHANGASFLVEDPEVEQKRADHFEISPTGPLFGYKMTPPTLKEAELEKTILEELPDPQRIRESWRQARLPGARRAYRVPIGDLHLNPNLSTGCLEMVFSLPSGSYASVLLRELLGNDRFLDEPSTRTSGAD